MTTTVEAVEKALSSRISGVDMRGLSEQIIAALAAEGKVIVDVETVMEGLLALDLFAKSELCRDELPSLTRQAGEIVGKLEAMLSAREV